ncbi:MAG TPA: hypothetical protein VKA21_02550 [Candidatus Binatia bacterium]|nr:hypothetical protein [Candidatus Binatia bacterium]
MGGRRIELCGVTIEVASESDEFARWLEGQFPETASGSGPPDVAVRVRWSEGPAPELTPATVFPDWPAPTRIDRHVWIGDGRLLCLRADDAPQIAIASAPGHPTRRLEVRFHFTLGGGWAGTARRLLRWRRIPALRRNRLSTLAYYAVYYPAWWHLEAQHRAHPLHAAAVAIDGRGLLLAGLPGCGKSTLATSLLGTAGTELLSDNVVLHDTSQVYGCFEPLLLDDRARACIAPQVPLVPVGRRHQYARDAFHLPHLTGGVPLAAAVVLARGPETRLQRIGGAECARMLLAINEAAKEVRRYHILAALFALVERDALAYVEERVAHLDRLLAGVPCWWLQVRDGAPAEATAALRELAARPREAAG